MPMRSNEGRNAKASFGDLGDVALNFKLSHPARVASLKHAVETEVGRAGQRR